MILAIILGTSALLAAWAGYWWSSLLLGTKANRASRTASVISPFVIAVVLAWASGLVLGANGIDIGVLPSSNPKAMAAIFFAIAIVLLIPTVLIAMLAGSLFKKHAQLKD